MAVPVHELEHVFLERNTAENKHGNESLLQYLRDPKSEKWTFPSDPLVFVDSTVVSATDIPVKLNEPVSVCMQCAIKAARTGLLAEDELAKRFVDMLPSIFDKLLMPMHSYYARYSDGKVFNLCRVALRLCIALIPTLHAPACLALEKILNSRSSFASYTQTNEERDLGWEGL